MQTPGEAAHPGRNSSAPKQRISVRSTSQPHNSLPIETHLESDSPTSPNPLPTPTEPVRPRPWTPEEDRTLIELALFQPFTRIGDILKRTHNACSNRYHKLFPN